MQQSGELVLITGDSPSRAKQADPLLFRRRSDLRVATSSSVSRAISASDELRTIAAPSTAMNLYFHEDLARVSEPLIDFFRV